MNPEIPKLADVINGELAFRGDWVVASIDARMSWPVKAQKVLYRGCALWVLLPWKIPILRVALELCTARSGTRRNGEPFDVMKFLARPSWVEGNCGRVEGSI